MSDKIILDKIKELEEKFEQAVEERANPEDFKDAHLKLQELQIEAQALHARYSILKLEFDIALLKTFGVGSVNIKDLSLSEAEELAKRVITENNIFFK